MGNLSRVVTVAVLLVAFVVMGIAEARDLVFKKTKIVVIAGDKTHEKKAVVTWGDSTVVVRFQSGKDAARYPGYEGVFRYDRMSDMVYERSKHSRIATAILLSPIALFSKRKHHWFSWNYVDADSSKRSVLLRIDKKEERLYRRQVPILTGLKLETVIED